MTPETCNPSIDRASFLLGMINSFVEMVACGVKQLALSPPLSPEDFELVGAASEEITHRYGVLWYLEESLMVSDLQSPEFTEGKVSILYFCEPETLEAYLNLKRRQIELEAAGRYSAGERRYISRKFMQLLSYPERVIEKKLSEYESNDPYMFVSDEDE